MVIIAAIGAFFKKIWDWIRQTAWIQPLLIVGIIFGVIFSIRPIVDAAKKGSESRKAASTFYHEYQKSLENGKDSDADKLTYTLENVMNSPSGQVDISGIKDKNGKQVYKFFLVYVAETCENCEAAKEGFDVLREKMGSDIFKPSNEYEAANYDFNMFTVFADQETSETEEKQTAFVKYLERHQSFFEDAGSRAYETPYYTNKPLSDTDLEYLETSDPDNFLTPTILLIELDDPNRTDGHSSDFPAGVTEVMFGVEGETAFDKAQTLLDCWNHEGKFSTEGKK